VSTVNLTLSTTTTALASATGSLDCATRERGWTAIRIPAKTMANKRIRTLMTRCMGCSLLVTYQDTEVGGWIANMRVGGANHNGTSSPASPKFSTQNSALVFNLTFLQRFTIFYGSSCTDLTILNNQLAEVNSHHWIPAHVLQNNTIRLNLVLLKTNPVVCTIRQVQPEKN